MLVKAMDELSLSLSEEVVIQTGRSKYVPQNCHHFRFMPSLTPYYERASLAVTHGGLGIITEVMKFGRPLVAVEDPEQPDRHQRQILEVWERDGHLIWCRDLGQLPQAIEQARTYQFTPYVLPECQIHTIIAEFLESLR
jgi:beta-1,4-N-acetylglucosaminyltransferase